MGVENERDNSTHIEDGSGCMMSHHFPNTQGHFTVFIGSRDDWCYCTDYPAHAVITGFYLPTNTYIWSKSYDGINWEVVGQVDNS